jgi:hypothetical protein
MSNHEETEEARRLAEDDRGEAPWKKWGPYLSERQWGTVREDYSPGGDAWNYFTHEQSRSRAYRWGEDGLGGISDDKQRLCFGLALWNGRDPILKERLFGLTNGEGNHGEDVKEYYFYLDSTPTHSYMKFLYKYPQAAYPYHDLVAENARRGRQGMEYELVDTGIFEQDRYFDVFVEYAKASPDDVLVKITAENRGPEAATLHLLPTLWFRNTWAGGIPPAGKPALQAIAAPEGESRIAAVHPELGRVVACFDEAPALLFTENETNSMRLWEQPNDTIYVKDAFHEHLIGGRKEAVNPELAGTKSAAHLRFEIPPGGARTVRVRLVAQPQGTSTPALGPAFGPAFERTFTERRREADDYYDSITPDGLGAGEGAIMRQALAGMLWSKQYYYFDLDHWLREHGANPMARPPRAGVRNPKWAHMINDDILSMPDKWEYPWYAAWDLAFHTTALGMVDRRFSREQIELMLSDRYLHPNGQVPAYEWNFGDVNPPVHAWATLYAYYQAAEAGEQDLDFLRGAFRKLLLNFTWWVNRKDADSRNVFEGGFLGLDNIGVFDRSAALPMGGTLEQADGTAWMAFFAQNMLEMSIELARNDPNYEPMVVKFAEHFLWIAGSMDHVGQTADELWDEEDGFFYDVLRFPDGHASRIKIRSMVGLLPLAATTVISHEDMARFPSTMRRIQSFIDRNPELTANIAPVDRPGIHGRHLLAVVTEEKLRRMLTRMLDPERFFSPYGIRSLSRWHKDHPYSFWVNGAEQRVAYLPAESDSGLFGGNSNWRGPIWMPVNVLIIRALLQFYLYYGDGFRIECPTGSGRLMNLYEVAHEIARRLISIFVRDGSGRRPVHGGVRKFQEDPHWRELPLYYEYFHGDNGAGIGASHQTGWTGTVAKLIQLFGSVSAKDVLDGGVRPTMSVFHRGERIRKAS